jgi:hypothetical protein
VHTQGGFELQPPLSFKLSPLGDTNRPRFIKLELKIKRPYLHAFFISVRPFLTGHGPLNVCESPWADIAILLFIKVEEIFGNCFEMWLYNNNNSTFMILGMSIINLLCQLQVKYYLVKIFIVQYNLPIKIQYHSFLDIRLCGLFSCMWNLTFEACPIILDTRCIQPLGMVRRNCVQHVAVKERAIKWNSIFGLVLSVSSCACVNSDLLVHEKHNAQCEVKEARQYLIVSLQFYFKWRYAYMQTKTKV